MRSRADGDLANSPSIKPNLPQQRRAIGANVSVDNIARIAKRLGNESRGNCWRTTSGLLCM